MAKILLFIFAVPVLRAPARRTQIQLAQDELVQDEEADKQTEFSSNPTYWDTHRGSWEFVAAGLVNTEFTQQFYVNEQNRFLQTRKFAGKLDQFETADSKEIEVRKNIGARVMFVDNKFWTMKAHQHAVFTNEQGTQVGDYTMFNPKVINLRYTWRVVKTSDPDNILFTIQKRLWNDHCKWGGMFSCKPVIKIYVGQKGDKSKLIYYGTGDQDLEEPDFKFYHSVADYKSNKRNWVGKVDHKKTKSMILEEDEYKVKVKPGEDAGLILLASICLDKVGDDAKLGNKIVDGAKAAAEAYATHHVENNM